MKTAAIHLSIAEIRHVLNLLMEDDDGDCYGNLEQYITRTDRLRDKMLEAQRKFSGGHDHGKSRRR